MQNYNVVTGERSDGMSPEEAQKKREDRAKDLPFSKGLEGGTQASILAVCTKFHATQSTRWHPPHQMVCKLVFELVCAVLIIIPYQHTDRAKCADWWRW